MAGPPTPERVRELLTDKKQTAADHDRNGDAFMADGRPSIAIMFYERSRTPDRIAKVLEAGVQSGDTFLVEWAMKMDPDRVTTTHWTKTGEAALAAKKYAFARDAFTRAGDATRTGEAIKGLSEFLK